MNINTGGLITFLIMWGVPTFLVVRAYLKMSDEDKKSAISDFTSRKFIFTIGFLIIGFFFMHLGSLLTISIIKLIGLVLFIIGGIFSIVGEWKRSKVKSMVVLGLLLLIIFLNIN